MFHINKQVPRGFAFIPALGWIEVGANTLIKSGKIQNYAGHKFDQYVNTVKVDNKLLAIYTIFNGNENRKDTNHIKRMLNETLKRHAC